MTEGRGGGRTQDSWKRRDRRKMEGDSESRLRRNEYMDRVMRQDNIKKEIKRKKKSRIERSVGKVGG